MRGAIQLLLEAVRGRHPGGAGGAAAPALVANRYGSAELTRRVIILTTSGARFDRLIGLVRDLEKNAPPLWRTEDIQSSAACSCLPGHGV
jgi:hypothetical protein